MNNFKPLFEDCTTKPLYIAGPCSAESREQTLAVARGVANAEVRIFRAGVWKPRTRPGSFEGVGAEALDWLREAKEQYGLHTITEVATTEHLEAALASGIDGVWIGARTTTNPFAVQELADALRGVDVAVLVKNPVNPDVDLWAGSIERIYNSGVRRLAAVHRGFGTYETSPYRNSPHWAVPIELRRRIPDIAILSDPSHIGGRRELVATLAQQALDRGFDGLMIETHTSPDEALSDAAQQITPDRLGEILQSLMWRRSADSGDILRDFRMHIDSIDSRILSLLAERMDIARDIGRFKMNNGIAIVQHDRFKELLSVVEERGNALGVSPKCIHRIFSAIHDESVRQQLENGADGTKA